MKQIAPVMRWSPEGEMRVFDHVSEVPVGWLNKHPNDPNTEPAPREPAPPETLSREQIVTALNARNIPFFKGATTRALYDKLLEAVERTEA